MIFRALAILVSLIVLALAAAMVVADPEILGTFGGKLTEGGMWTAVAAFLALAVVLGLRPRGADGRPRTRFGRR